MKQINQTIFSILYKVLKISILALAIISCSSSPPSEESNDSSTEMAVGSPPPMASSSEEIAVDSTATAVNWGSGNYGSAIEGESPPIQTAPMIGKPLPVIISKESRPIITENKPIIGSTNFIVPEEMIVDTTYMGSLGISTILTKEEIKEILLTQNREDNPESTKPDSSFISLEKKIQIKVFPKMKAVLMDPTESKKNFEVKNITAEWQDITEANDSLYTWIWNITPKIEGKYKLQFAIYGKGDTSENEKLVKVFNHNITVKAVKLPLTFPQKIKKYISSFNEYYSLIFTGGFGAFILLIWNRLFKRKNENQ